MISAGILRPNTGTWNNSTGICLPNTGISPMGISYGDSLCLSMFPTAVELKFLIKLG